MDVAARKSGSPGDLGALLRHWRQVRGKSQWDLALDTGISQRHISFIESGRSIPRRQKLMDIAEGLDIPLQERNLLLLASGYAPVYSDSLLDAPEMASITKVLKRALHQHEPFPAVVMDRYWNVVMTNDAAPGFFGRFIDMASRPEPRNLLHLMFDPKGMRPFIADWDTVSKSLFARIYRETVGHALDDKTKELIAALLAYADGDGGGRMPQAATDAVLLPMVPIGFVTRDRILSYFSMITTVGTPQTITAQELRVECMYPADAATESYHHEFMAWELKRPAAR
jgi:transcriptional regulator with XRE-family HTH domain